MRKMVPFVSFYLNGDNLGTILEKSDNIIVNENTKSLKKKNTSYEE